MDSKTRTVAEAFDLLSSERAMYSLSVTGLSYWLSVLQDYDARLEGITAKSMKGSLTEEEDAILGFGQGVGDGIRRLKIRMRELLERPELTEDQKPIALDYLNTQIKKLQHEDAADPVKNDRRIEAVNSLVRRINSSTAVKDGPKYTKAKSELAKIEQLVKELAPRYDQYQKGKFHYKTRDKASRDKELQTFLRQHGEAQDRLAAAAKVVNTLGRLRGPDGSGGSPNAPMQPAEDDACTDDEYEKEYFTFQRRQRGTSLQAAPKRATGKKGKQSQKAVRKGKSKDGGDEIPGSIPVIPVDNRTTTAWLNSLVNDSCLLTGLGMVSAVAADKNDDGEAYKVAVVDKNFAMLQEKLPWHNCLGLGRPSSGMKAKEAWAEFTKLEIDWGPRRTSRKESPGVVRIMKNATDNLVQYAHIIFAMMLIRSAWRCGLLSMLFMLQLIAVYVPLSSTMNADIRLVGIVGVHAILWFLFFLEAVCLTYLFEKLAVGMIIVAHAYVVRPAGT